MKVTENVWVLPLGNGRVNPALIKDGKELILIDTGFEGQFGDFEKAFAEAGFSVSDVTQILFTHQDRDHIGCTAEFLAANGSIKTWASPVNAKVHIDHEVGDGEELPFCGITAVSTPGHKPEHICYYIKPMKAMVTGDALNIANGRLTGANPAYTLDMKLAEESIKKLLGYDIDTIISYHGGVYDKDAKGGLIQLVNSFE